MYLFVITLVIFSYGSAAPPNGRIYNGKLAERGQFPYQISLQYCQPPFDCYHACGGAILSSNWIVLAGHCFSEEPEFIIEKYYKVLAGIINLDDDNTIEARQLVDIDEAFVHPNFDYGDGISFDISVAKLAQPLEFSDQVQPVKLPEPGFEAEGWTVVAGWGVTEYLDDSPNTLLYAELPVLPTIVCAEIHDKLLKSRNYFNATANMCNGPLIGVPSTCYGDSGSPLVQNGTIVGIVSWSMRPCGHPGYPSVYIKVSTYLDFIREHVTGL